MFTKTRTTDIDADQTETPARRRRPSSAHVTAGLALFVALGGTSYAAGSLAANSVGSSQIKASAVKSSELAKNAVTSVKVKDGSLLKADFKAGELPAGAQGAQGPQGLKGDTGPAGEKGAKGDTGAAGADGAAGTNGVSGYEVVTSTTNNLADGATAQLTATCTGGKKPVGGGVTMSASTGIELNRSGLAGVSSWTIRVTNNSGSAENIQAQAVCVTAD